MQKVMRDYLGRPFSGIHVQYLGPDGRVVQVARCLDPSLYVNPGYYAATCNQLPLLHPVHKRRYGSAKACALAVWRAGGYVYKKEIKQ